jgi:hypothetical protein
VPLLRPVFSPCPVKGKESRIVFDFHKDLLDNMINQTDYIYVEDTNE